MAQRKIIHDDADPAQKIYPDLPNYVATEAEFIAAVEVGLAEIDAGQTVPFDIVAADLRRTIHGKA
jgi:predicted transcriptional regulator